MDTTSALLTYGPLGVFVALFVLGLVVPKPDHVRVLSERDKALDQRDELVEDVHTKVVPALERATEAIREREGFEDDVLAVLTDVRRLLEGHQP